MRLLSRAILWKAVCHESGLEQRTGGALNLVHLVPVRPETVSDGL